MARSPVHLGVFLSFVIWFHWQFHIFSITSNLKLSKKIVVSWSLWEKRSFESDNLQASEYWTSRFIQCTEYKFKIKISNYYILNSSNKLCVWIPLTLVSRVFEPRAIWTFFRICFRSQLIILIQIKKKLLFLDLQKK